MFSIERRRPARNSVRLIRNLREKNAIAQSGRQGPRYLTLTVTTSKS